MGVLSDQGLLNLYLDAHQLGRRTKHRNKSGNNIRFQRRVTARFLSEQSITTTYIPPSFLPAREGTLRQMPELRCRSNSLQTEWLGRYTPNAASMRSQCCMIRSDDNKIKNNGKQEFADGKVLEPVHKSLFWRYVKYSNNNLPE